MLKPNSKIFSLVKKKKNTGYARLEIDGNEGNFSQETKGPEVWVSEWNFGNENGLTVLKVSTKRLMSLVTM